MFSQKVFNCSRQDATRVLGEHLERPASPSPFLSLSLSLSLSLLFLLPWLVRRLVPDTLCVFLLLWGLLGIGG